MQKSKVLGTYDAPKGWGAVKCIGKVRMPLLCPKMHLERPHFKTRQLCRWHPPCPSSEGRGGSVPPSGACCHLLQQSSRSARSPKLMLQSFIVACYAKRSLSVPLPSDLTSENQINCHLSWKEIFGHCQPIIWARNGLGSKLWGLFFKIWFSNVPLSFLQGPPGIQGPKVSQ